MNCLFKALAISLYVCRAFSVNIEEVLNSDTGAIELTGVETSVENTRHLIFFSHEVEVEHERLLQIDWQQENLTFSFEHHSGKEMTLIVNKNHFLKSFESKNWLRQEQQEAQEERYEVTFNWYKTNYIDSSSYTAALFQFIFDGPPHTFYSVQMILDREDNLIEISINRLKNNGGEISEQLFIAKNLEIK